MPLTPREFHWGGTMGIKRLFWSTERPAMFALPLSADRIRKCRVELDNLSGIHDVVRVDRPLECSH
jgi:hypothetical protein